MKRFEAFYEKYFTPSKKIKHDGEKDTAPFSLTVFELIYNRPLQKNYEYMGLLLDSTEANGSLKLNQHQCSIILQLLEGHYRFY